MYSGWLHLNEVVSAGGEGEVAVIAAAASVVNVGAVVSLKNAGVVVGSTNAGVVVGSTNAGVVVGLKNAGVVVGSMNAGAAEVTGVEVTAFSVKTCSTAVVVDDTTTASVFEGFEIAEIAGVVVSITAASYPVKVWPPYPGRCPEVNRCDETVGTGTGTVANDVGTGVGSEEAIVTGIGRDEVLPDGAGGVPPLL
jgi:hypothetical protein